MIVRILPKSINERKQLEDNINRRVHWYGFNDLETKPESYHDALLKILYAIKYDYTYPLIVYILVGNIVDLEEISHTDIDYLNEVGIRIYLNEPVSLGYIDGQLRAPELDSILVYMQNNNLNNVTVHTCDYRCEELLPYYNAIKLVTDDVFIKTIGSTRTTIATDQFTKHFINLNWRYTEHRHLVAAFMYQLDSYCSWRFKVDYDALEVHEWSDLNKLDIEFNGRITNGIILLNENAPCKIDYTGPAIKINDVEDTLAINPPTKSSDEDIEPFYADIFCDIVTETKYAQPLANISEKTLRPIGFLKPFILVAPPRSLEYLRTLGYKTFSDYWDESYDLEDDHNLRLIKIFKLIDELNNKSIDELRILYNDMLPVLKHNYDLLVEKLPNKTMAQNLLDANPELRRAIWKSKTVPPAN